jgi:adenine deaminase
MTIHMLKHNENLYGNLMKFETVVNRLGKNSKMGDRMDDRMEDKLNYLDAINYNIIEHNIKIYNKTIQFVYQNRENAENHECYNEHVNKVERYI